MDLHIATQRADFSRIDIDQAMGTMRGKTYLLGGKSVGVFRWLKLADNDTLSPSFGPEGKPTRFGFAGVAYLDKDRLLMVVRQGWTFQKDDDTQNMIVEVWWKIADKLELSVLESRVRHAERGEALSYGMLMRPFAGDAVLFELAKREMISIAAGIATVVAIAGIWGIAGQLMRGPSTPQVQRITPVNGDINVGGGHETPGKSNLNPIKPHSGGPSEGIPNHVRGSMEEMDRLFVHGSAKFVMSSRLRYGDVDWQRGTKAAYVVMRPGGKVEMNVWASKPEAEQLKVHFQNAGFKNVDVKGDGVGTMVHAEK